VQPDGPFFFLTTLKLEMKDALLGLLVASLTGLLLLGSCGGLMGNGEEEKTKVDSTYFRVTLNGEETWDGVGVAGFTGISGLDWLQIRGGPGREENRLYMENLNISVPYQGEKSYSLTRVLRDSSQNLTSGTSYYEKEGDVTIAGYFATDDSFANQLTITEYDTTAGIMEGTFRTTVVVDSADRESEPGQPARRRPDTLRFTDGEFRVEVEDRRDE